MKIYKYPLGLKSGTQVIKMTKYWEVLCCKVQGEIPCLWVSFDETEKEEEDRYFTLQTTGHIFQDEFTKDKKSYFKSYIDTFFLDDGVFVGHVYETYEEYEIEGLNDED